MFTRWDFLAFIGVSLILLGIVAIYWPLALIILGVFVVSVAAVGNRREKKNKDSHYVP